MSRNYLSPHILLLLLLVLSSCNSNETSNNLKAWEGEYFYEEQPIKALAGYFMVMEWKLAIYKEVDKYIGKIEITGQQTHMIVQTIVTGDEKRISLLYDKTIEGFTDNLKASDTLFKLIKEDKEIVTKWGVLEPRLSEKSPKECSCFKD